VEILSVNSIASKDILMKMRSFSGSEKQAVEDKEIERYFGILFWMFYGEQKNYHLQVAASDSIISVIVPGVSNNEFFKLRNRYCRLMKADMINLPCPGFRFAG
jgi:hypothetical protein